MFDITTKFSVMIEGRGKIDVTPNDHVASGGEGHVYRPGNGTIALKVWDDPHRAISGRMVEKIKLLSALTDPSIVAPQALVRDRSGHLIGYVMAWVSGWDLTAAFTNDWRSANNFGDSDALTFAEKMREVVIYTHEHDIVMGDANELNILGVNGEPRYIDVDPWLPPGYSGDKIVPTIQDWHHPIFTREADWFAWASVTFQLLTGIHPYRGTHPDFKRGALEERMKANASVFDPKVKLNPNVRPLSIIPINLRNWYEVVFQNGHRVPPPKVRTTPQTKTATVSVATRTVGKLTISEAFTLASPFTRMVAPDIMRLSDGTLVSLPDGRAVGSSSGSVLRAQNGLISADVGPQGLVWCDQIPQTGQRLPGVGAMGLWTSGNRLFAITHNGILELLPRDVKNGTALFAGQKWSLNPNSTVFGDGSAVFDALGAKYLVLPQDKGVEIVRVPEIDGLKPVSLIGKGKTAVLSLIDRTGSYHRATILLGSLGKHTVNMAMADDGTLTDVILNGDNGTILWINQAGELGVTGGGTFPLGGASGGKLIAEPSGVFCVVGLKVYRLSMNG